MSQITVTQHGYMQFIMNKSLKGA